MLVDRNGLNRFVDRTDVMRFFSWCCCFVGTVRLCECVSVFCTAFLQPYQATKQPISIDTFSPINLRIVRHLNIDINKFDGESHFPVYIILRTHNVHTFLWVKFYWQTEQFAVCDALSFLHVLHLRYTKYGFGFWRYIGAAVYNIICLFGLDYIKSFRLKFATCCTNYQWFILIRLLFVVCVYMYVSV